MIKEFEKQLKKEKEMEEDIVLLDNYLPDDIEFFEKYVSLDVLEARSVSIPEPEAFVPFQKH